MLHQSNGKHLSKNETIVASQGCTKVLWSPVTCDSQRVKRGGYKTLQTSKIELKFMYLCSKSVVCFKQIY